MDSKTYTNMIKYFKLTVMTFVFAALFTACGGGSSIDDSGSVSDETTTVSTSTDSVVADGSQGAFIIVTVRDAQGNLITDAQVSLAQVVNGSSPKVNAVQAAADSTITGPVNNNDGTYTFTVTNTKAETVTYTVTVDGVVSSDTVTVVFVPGAINAAQSSLVASPTQIVADGNTTSTLTLTLRDENDNLISDAEDVTFLNVGSSVLTTVVNNNDGTYTTTATSIVAELVTYAALADTVAITQVANVTFVPDAADADESNVTATVTSLVANGVATSTITVTARDANNNLISGVAVILTQGAGSSTVSDDGNTNASGVYTYTVTSIIAETVTYTATADDINITQTAAVTFVPDAVNAGTATVDTNSSSVVADGASQATITVTVEDINNNLILDANVSLAQGAGSSTVGVVSNDGSGIYTFVVSSSVAETVTYVATADSVTISDAAEVIFTPGVVDAGTSTILANTATVDADGSSTAHITVTAKDINGNFVEGVAVTLTGSPSDSNISTDGNTSADGTYLYTVSSVVAGDINYTATVNTDTISPSVTIDFIDVTRPILTLSGDENISFDFGRVTYYVLTPGVLLPQPIPGPKVDAGATAEDDVDGDITSNIAITDNVDVDVLGTYTVYYNVADATGNDANEITRTVNIVAATPLISSGFYTIEENATIGQAVGNINIVTNGGTAITSINLSGTGNENFEVSTRGEITVKNTLDFETNEVYNLEVVAVNAQGASGTLFLIINVTDVLEIPVNLTIDNVKMLRAVGSIKDILPTPYNTIDIQGGIDSNGYKILVPYTVVNAQVTLPAYSVSAILDSSVTSNSENNIIVSFAWAEQNLSVGSDRFEANLTIDDSLGFDDGNYSAVQLDVQDDILGIAAAVFPYLTDSNYSVGSLTLQIYPGIPDRMFGIQDNDGNASSHMFLYLPVVSATGKTWLNNNLGADYTNMQDATFDITQQAIASNDYHAYGSLFQWGRKSDGHELVRWTSNNTGTASSSVNIVSGNKDPGHASFIENPSDWLSPLDDTLWENENSSNNVCPLDYRLATQAGGELDAERAAWASQNIAGGYASTLKWTASGIRSSLGILSLQELEGIYWSSAPVGVLAGNLSFDSNASMDSGVRTIATPVRCIKD